MLQKTLCCKSLIKTTSLSHAMHIRFLHNIVALGLFKEMFFTVLICGRSAFQRCKKYQKQKSSILKKVWTYPKIRVIYCLWYAPSDMISLTSELGMAMKVPLGSSANVRKVLEMLETIDSTRLQDLPDGWRDQTIWSIYYYPGTTRLYADLYYDSWGRDKIDQKTAWSRNCVFISTRIFASFATVWMMVGYFVYVIAYWQRGNFINNTQNDAVSVDFTHGDAFSPYSAYFRTRVHARWCEQICKQLSSFVYLVCYYLTIRCLWHESYKIIMPPFWRSFNELTKMS